ncbi:MAG: hypothetical protein GC204_06930 [Chloroflexi bacterium]|nr:hypothetical protein [Chloroflexota bacterium]
MPSHVTKETTILYGVLIRIGGYARPRAYMQFLDGQKLSCSISNRSVAIAMAAHLYQSIGVRGIAVWDKRDKCLRGFHIQELMPTSRDSTQPNALKGLVDMVEKYYDTPEE